MLIIYAAHNTSPILYIQCEVVYLLLHQELEMCINTAYFRGNILSIQGCMKAEQMKQLIAITAGSTKLILAIL
jgi:hypothetical protein